MAIGCLGWGSLIWNPEQLPLRGQWFQDGPLLPIEFARQSKSGALTLVLVPGYASIVRSHWAVLEVASAADAREALRKQEEVLEKNLDKHIGMWAVGGAAPETCPSLPEWAKAHGLDAVVWTTLAPKIGSAERTPSVEEALHYLRGLGYAAGQQAERYIRLAPRQVDTPYRREFAVQLGWSCTSQV